MTKPPARDDRQPYPDGKIELMDPPPLWWAEAVRAIATVLVACALAIAIVAAFGKALMSAARVVL